MKQILQRFILLALMISSFALAGKKGEKDDGQTFYTMGKTALSPDQANVASSPWLPLNLETANSQYKVAEFFKNGFVLVAGARLTAPLLGNYYGYYSKDSGKTFTKFSFPNLQSSATSTSMRFPGLATWGDSVMINADYAGLVIRSTNWGVKWDTVSQKYGTGAFYDGVKFISKDTVIAYGDAVDSTMFINRSTNRGATWTRVTIPGSLASGYVFASAGSKSIASFGNTVWMGAYVASAVPVSAAGILKSTDAGVTWSFIKATNLLAKNRYSFINMSFKDANVGYGIVATAGYVSTLHKTTDGGATWSDTINVAPAPITSPLQQQVAQVQALQGTGIVLVSGFDGFGPATWKSTDDGVTWAKLVTPVNTGAAASLGNIAFISETIGIGSGTRQVLNYKPSVEVTFIVNSSTVPDTLKSTSTVQMRGDPGASGGILDWNGNSSVRFTNIGGDYWRARVRFAPGTAFPYKLYTHAQANVGGGHPGEHNGWEANLSPTNDRMMTVGQNDTTLAVQFVNGVADGKPYFWRPYTETDSLEVTFRVNMANQEDFNPATMKVGVNGSFQGWGTPSSFVLKQETNHGNGGSVAYNGTNFWSGTFKLPLKKANTDTLSAPITYFYKFVQFANAAPTTYTWETISDRSFDIKKGSQDTTLYWKWWDNVGVKPPAGTDTAIVQFRVDMTRAIQTNGYTTGDTVQVRYGFSNSAEVVGIKNLAKQGLTNIYAATDSSIKKVNIVPNGTGKPLVYQYYIVKNGQDFRESYYNFGYTGADQTLAERRLLYLTAKSNTALDTSKDQTKANRWPFFRNTRKLTQNVDVKFSVNLKPAYFQVSKGAVGKDTLYDIQGPWTINKGLADSIYKWGVSINGPAAGSWAAWGTSLYADTTRKLYDDGTHGDATAGDRIYTRIIKFYKDSVNNVVGQEFKFGIHGGDNEGGKGGFGNNHIENINDAATTATIHSQWGSINPLYYDQWNFASEVNGVGRINDVTPSVYSLDQNYPNPFNPSTTINYSIPVNGLVTLKIYNVLGQEVAMLVNEVQTVGNYKATFNGTSLSSGVYFYKIESGSFTSVKKMMFLK